MRIIAASDVHCRTALELPKGDMGILAGDLTFMGLRRPQEVAKMERWFTSQMGKFKHGLWWVQGNHDWDCVSENLDGYPNLQKGLLSDQLLEVEGKKIWFSPWSPEFCGWAFMKYEHELVDVYKNIPEGLDILVSHSPAMGHCDFIREQDKHVGSMALLARLHEMEKPPKVLLSGHIHAWSDQDKESDLWTENSCVIKCYNVSVCDDDYKLVNEPLCLDL